MKLIYASLFILAFVLIAAAQKSDDILATATGHTFKLSDMPPDVQAQMAKLPGEVQKSRTDILEQMINARVLDAEALVRKISAGDMIKRELAAIPAPTEAEIKAIYDANRPALGSKTLQQVRKQIVSYLRRDPEQKKINALITSLRAKYKVVMGKDVKAPDLAPADVVATVNGQRINAAAFDANAKSELYGLRAEYADFLLDKLNEAIYLTLVSEEAKTQNIEAGALISREITSKLKDYSDQEQTMLRNAFVEKLYAK
ncbi:MAG: hypothetical protein ABIV21_05555, partial [Pyrinomonadaceae bacterium]